MEMETSSMTNTSENNIVWVEIASSTIASTLFGENHFDPNTLKVPFWIIDDWNNGQGTGPTFDYTHLRYWFPNDMNQESIDRFESIRDFIAGWEDSDDKTSYLKIFNDIITKWYAYQDNTPPTLPPPPPPVDA